MQILNRLLNLREFERYTGTYDFGPKPPQKLVIHHTWRPTVASWQGQRSILGLKGYYERKGWRAGPHLFVAEDGIWLFSPMRHDGIHAGPLNRLSIGIEVVGDYDEKVWRGATKRFALGSIKILMHRLGLSSESLFFHRDVSAKSCPGRAITKQWLMDELDQFDYTSTPFRETVASISVSPSSTGSTVPEWAREGVDFVRRHQLFEVNTSSDMRDAVKFHRFYQLIRSSS